MRRTESLLRALLGKGAGAIEIIRSRIGQFATITNGVTVEFGVSGSVFPHVGVHRGGAGEQITLEDHIRIVTPRQRAFLHHHGVHLKKETLFLRTPRRPFLSDNPTARRRTTAIFARHLVQEPLQGGA